MLSLLARTVHVEAAPVLTERQRQGQPRPPAAPGGGLRSRPACSPLAAAALCSTARVPQRAKPSAAVRPRHVHAAASASEAGDAPKARQGRTRQPGGEAALPGLESAQPAVRASIKKARQRNGDASGGAGAVDVQQGVSSALPSKGAAEEPAGAYQGRMLILDAMAVCYRAHHASLGPSGRLTNSHGDDTSGAAGHLSQAACQS